MTAGTARSEKQSSKLCGMGKQIHFALMWCAAALLGVSYEGKSGAQTPGQQASTRQSQTSAKQASGQHGQTTPAPAIPSGYRLLSLKEGQAIAQGMAWADDEEGLAPDCSHLVHTLYQQAGYPYPYASSLDLYRGAGQFRRVRYAQPGDLIVWRGHVGIVMNPREHSFFSSVRSGTQIQNYRSTYWRSRGYPRFFRYLTKKPLPGGAAAEAASRPGQPMEQGVLGGMEDPPNLRAVKTVSARTAGTPHGNGIPDKSHEEIASANKARAENPSPTPSVPILIKTGGKQPKAADVASALEAANLEAGEMLRAANLEKLERPIVVYRQLHVSGVELKGKRGTAQIQVETVAKLDPERREPQPGCEDRQLELQHTKKGWVIASADQNVYVPRDGAMRILAARLAALTQSTERSTEKDHEQADIVRFLNLLVE